MTKRNAYVLGWVYGQINRALGKQYDPDGVKSAQAAMRPLSGMAAIHTAAVRAGKVSGELADQISAALEEVEVGDLPEGTQEPVQALDAQGAWRIGYQGGVSGMELRPEEG